MAEEETKLARRIKKLDEELQLKAEEIKGVQNQFKENCSSLLNAEVNLNRIHDTGYGEPVCDVIKLVNSLSSSDISPIRTNVIASKHSKMLKHIEFSPVHDNNFITSSSDGIVKVWEYQGYQSGVREVTAVNVGIDPSDISFNPDGGSMVCVYPAVEGREHIAVLSIDATCEAGYKLNITPLVSKPHEKGGIKKVAFMTAELFVTAGLIDRSVAAWKETKDKKWSPSCLHKGWHKDNIMGLCGLRTKCVALSVGNDKRLFGVDCKTNKETCNVKLDAKGHGIIANPCDFNAFCVYTNSPGIQLRLIDYRVKNEVGRFGWIPSNTAPQTSFVRQDWSPNGLLISTGSSDTRILLFDIRVNSVDPCMTISAHGKRVVKAAFHHVDPTLVSISPDLFVGIHHFNKRIEDMAATNLKTEIRLNLGEYARLQSEFDDCQRKRANTERQLSILRDPGNTEVYGTKKIGANDVISLIGSLKSSMIGPVTTNHTDSEHTGMLKHIMFTPGNADHFITSSSDRLVKLWKFQPKECSAKQLSSIDASAFQTEPSDLAISPHGDRLICVYPTSKREKQLAVITILKKKLKIINQEPRPHMEGGINRVAFMPDSEGKHFITAGCADRAVVLWKDAGNHRWEPEELHKDKHTNNIMGVCGLFSKPVAVSVGKDKRVIGVDYNANGETFNFKLDAQCYGIVANPVDFNLLLVYGNNPGKQISLLDWRKKDAEICKLGWRQTTTSSLSSLVTQDWSPSGRLISSGSSDSSIYLFDVRFKSNNPSEIIEAHNKRVFKAAFHDTRRMLVSISSDLHIGFHVLNDMAYV